MKSCAIINTSTVLPHRNYVSKSDETVLCQIYLNKLWIPDVLIDIIKDYLYIDAKEVLRKYHRSVINISIRDLIHDSFHYVDTFGRRRLTVWSIGHLYCAKPEIQLQQAMCITCGEKCDFHPNVNGCCVLEWDGEDGTLELDVENSYMASAVEEEVGETSDDYNDIDEDDRYDNWNPWAEYNPYRDVDEDDDEKLYDGYYRTYKDDDSEDRNTYSIRK